MRIARTYARISDELHYIIVGMREIENITYVEATQEIAEYLMQNERFRQYFKEGKLIKSLPFQNLFEETRIDNIVKFKD